MISSFHKHPITHCLDSWLVESLVMHKNTLLHKCVFVRVCIHFLPIHLCGPWKFRSSPAEYSAGPGTALLWKEILLGAWGCVAIGLALDVAWVKTKIRKKERDPLCCSQSLLEPLSQFGGDSPEFSSYPWQHCCLYFWYLLYFLFQLLLSFRYLVFLPLDVHVACYRFIYRYFFVLVFVDCQAFCLVCLHQGFGLEVPQYICSVTSNFGTSSPYLAQMFVLVVIPTLVMVPCMSYLLDRLRSIFALWCNESLVLFLVCSGPVLMLL